MLMTHPPHPCWNNNAYDVSRHIPSTADLNINTSRDAKFNVSTKGLCSWQGKHINFHIDNQAVVYSLKFGRMKDNVIQAIGKTI